MTKIVIEHEGKHWSWALEVNGEVHEGNRAQTPMEAVADAEHLRSCLWWKRNKGKPDNGASLDVHDYVRPQKTLSPVMIGNAEEKQRL